MSRLVVPDDYSQCNVIPVSRVSESKIYVMFKQGHVAVLTAEEYSSHKYKWQILSPNCLMNGNSFRLPEGASMKETVKYYMDPDTEIYEFDSLKEVAVFLAERL